jgi:hypothetical protein
MKTRFSFLKWSPSGFRSFQDVAFDHTGELGLDIECRGPDGDMTTMRVTIRDDGSLSACEPIHWKKPSLRPDVTLKALRKSIRGLAASIPEDEDDERLIDEMIAERGG